jgi:hypothetical protein
MQITIQSSAKKQEPGSRLDLAKRAQTQVLVPNVIKTDNESSHTEVRDNPMDGTLEHLK